jgi:hypothetical protein
MPIEPEILSGIGPVNTLDKIANSSLPEITPWTDPELVSITGEPTPRAIEQKKKIYNQEREREFWMVDEAMTVNNTLYDVLDRVDRELKTTDDPNFDSTKMLGILDGVPAQFHKDLYDSDSEYEVVLKKARIQEYLTNADKLAAAGYTGIAASLAAGIIDADALLIPFGGGLGAAGKVGKVLSRPYIPNPVKGFAQGAASGAEAGAVVSVAGAVGGTVTDHGDIPATILMGMGLGATVGATINPYPQMDTAMKVHKEYTEAKANNFKPAYTVQSSAESVGAARVRTVPTPTTLRPTTVPWFDKAADDGNAVDAYNVLKGLSDSETTNVDNFIGVSAQKVQNWVDKTPLKSLYTSVADMGIIGNKLAYDLLNHPGGMISNTTPGSHYDSMYTQDLSQPIQNYHKHAMKFMNRPTGGLKSNASNMFVGKTKYREFDRAINIELETRLHDGKGDPDAHPSVKAAADDLDNMHAKAVGILQGRSGETSVVGSENLEVRSGYRTRRWSGEEMRKFDQNKIVDALVKGYTKLLTPGAVVDMDTVRSIVRSMVLRSKALDEGIDTNLIGLLRDGGKEFVRDTLQNNNISDDQIDAIINAFVGNAEERAKPGFLKKRIELDLRVPIEGTDKLLLDLLEPDLYKSTHKYIRKVAGTAALARKGYQLGDKTAIIESIKDEMVANGKDVNDPRINDILETAFSYFGAGAVGGGIDPLLLSAMRLTRQSLLGSLGLTQLSELGGVISAVGVEAAIKAMPGELKSIFTGKKTPLVQEMHDAFIFLDKDHILYDDELALDSVGRSTIVQSQFADYLHKNIAFGDKLLGHTSLFYKAMAFSQNFALSSVNHKLHKLLSSGELDKGAYRRLLDLGMDENLVTALQRYIDNGTIKKVDGQLEMNFKEWDHSDLQDYKMAMYTFVSRGVQKSLAGETSYWATKQFGQAVAQLRMYPLQAFQKQFLRNMRHADSTTATALLYNLGIAGLVYATSQIVKGNGDELTMEKITKGAISYAPTTGWLPMATDPLAEILGMPGLRMNKYGPPGRATDGIIPVPPMIPTLNRIAHIPSSLIKSLDGVDKQEAAALAATPIVGSAYGFSALFNYLKDN